MAASIPFLLCLPHRAVHIPGLRMRAGAFPSEEPFFPLSLVIRQVELSRTVEAFLTKTSKHAGTFLNCVPSPKDVEVLIPSTSEHGLIWK